MLTQSITLIATDVTDRNFIDHVMNSERRHRRRWKRWMTCDRD
jgi:hypothetical protein